MNRYRLTPSPSAAKEQRARDYVHAFEQLSWAEDKIIAICQHPAIGVNVVSGTFCYVRIHHTIMVRFYVAAIDDKFKIHPAIHLGLQECEADDLSVAKAIKTQIDEQVLKSKQPPEYIQALSRIRNELDQRRNVQDQGQRIPPKTSFGSWNDF